jgi:alpha-glucosidase (family GH31 glycosyl hydrolase)
MQVKASNAWFKSQKKRPMIISRSSYAGMGKYGSKWLGDNHATVTDMEISVISSMKMNIFGIAFIGADICGFAGPQTTPDLCTRWH